MSRPDRFTHLFHPVGQGLFATGSLHCKGANVPAFIWVYDCGTSSSQRFLEEGILRLAKWCGERREIDLLTLSHFDNDHISGVSRLVKEFKVKTVLLPYMPLAQRLQMAFDQHAGNPEDPLTAFYVNPAAYLLALEGAAIEQIVFVMPSGKEGPPFLAEGDDSPPDEGGDDATLLFEAGDPEDQDEVEMLLEAVSNTQGRVQLRFLRRGASLRVQSWWEFLPYNDSELLPKISAMFLKAVAEQREHLLNARQDEAAGNALMKLKRLYDRQFGGDSTNRNAVSLFLYSGPIYSTWKRVRIFPRHHRYNAVDEESGSCGSAYNIAAEVRRCSILYTGDGYLNTPTRLDRFINYMNPNRIDRTGVFQVMHHGSSKNWHQGLAQAISPVVSVFSSDPFWKGWEHPHPPVLRDFWPYGATQVDNTGQFLEGTMLRKWEEFHSRSSCEVLRTEIV